VPRALHARYLLRGKGERRGLVRVAPELRARVKFQRLNFMAQRYPLGEFHVVFFRNVMIYFDRPTQQDVLGRMAHQIVPGGYLFIGHTESVAGLSLPLVAEATAVLRKPL
jgi:chemotaxis protein methyltransferase CheR